MTGPQDRFGPVRGEWAIWWLVRLMPRDFRKRHGVDLIECHRDAWRDRVAGRGFARGAWFWAMQVVATCVALVGRWWIVISGGASSADKGVGMGWDSWVQELRQAGRRIRRRPGFSLVVVLTLGMGLGVNTAVFSVFQSVLMAPLPYEQSEQLVRIYGIRRDRPSEATRNYLAAPAAVSKSPRQLHPVPLH